MSTEQTPAPEAATSSDKLAAPTTAVPTAALPDSAQPTAALADSALANSAFAGAAQAGSTPPTADAAPATAYPGPGATSSATAPASPAAGSAGATGSAGASPALRKPRPRTSPIVWGSLILMFCAYVAVRTAGGSIDPTAWLITTILGLGTLLLGVGIAVLVRSSRDKR